MPRVQPPDGDTDERERVKKSTGLVASGTQFRHVAADWVQRSQRPSATSSAHPVR